VKGLKLFNAAKLLELQGTAVKTMDKESLIDHTRAVTTTSLLSHNSPGLRCVLMGVISHHSGFQTVKNHRHVFIDNVAMCTCPVDDWIVVISLNGGAGSRGQMAYSCS